VKLTENQSGFLNVEDTQVFWLKNKKDKILENIHKADDEIQQLESL
jgi:hypothetical protein